MAKTVDQTKRLMRVGELAERSGKTTRAIRFYEEMDLLRPVTRTQGGYRQFDEQALFRVHWIDRLQEMGFSLRETRTFLDGLREHVSAPEAMLELRVFYREKLKSVREQQVRLSTLESELRESLNFLDACQSCDVTTPRDACLCCDAPSHSDTPQPILVAAVQESPL